MGDYTGTLAQRLRPGQTVRVEGPYGRFDLERRNPKARQIWIAGGIGVTPFLAWLESLQPRPDQAPVAELHYCTRDQDGDAFVPRLQALWPAGVQLHIHGARQGNTLKAAALHGAEKARSGSAVPADWQTRCAKGCTPWAHGPASTRRRLRCVDLWS